MIKIKWKVSSAPTGRYRSFDERAWPTAEYSDGTFCAYISCADEYTPERARGVNELIMHVADHSKTEWPWLTVKERYKTLHEAKNALKEILKNNRTMMPIQYR